MGTMRPGATRIAAPASKPASAATPVVVVAGDVTINWFLHGGVNRPDDTPRRSGSASSAARTPAWRRQPGAVLKVCEGGALLLAREVRAALEGTDPPARVVSYQVSDLQSVGSDEAVRSFALLERSAGNGGAQSQTIRPSRLQGFSGPDRSGPSSLKLSNDEPAARVIVALDAGNDFRHDSDDWPIGIRAESGAATVVLQAGRNLSDNPLLAHLRATRGDRLVLIVDADDLRADGISISRRVSWERTARELVWQIQHNPDLQALAGVRAVIIRLGLDGAVHYQVSGNTSTARLYFDPRLPEGGFAEDCGGQTLGAAEAFTAAITARVVREGAAGIGEGIRDGIRSARRFAGAGLGTDAMNPDFPGAEIFLPAAPGEATIADAAIPSSASADSADPDYWCLIDELSDRGLEPLAHQILLGDESGLRNVPMGTFGDLKTVDRSEIESFSSIQSLIGQYLARRETKRPLCLAVFGPPGSGKSFGVEQVAKSVGRTSGARVEKLEFNMSQFESTRSLVTALHRVRDEVVKGRVPIVFFDEFDSYFGGPLGWLRYFLAPMQDGAFQDGDTIHPVGKSIFVFAGGLSDTFARFGRIAFDPNSSAAEQADEVRRFREAKGPDFVSRLRGFVNVKGPNADPARPDDRFHLIRRAMIAKSLLERNWSSLKRRDGTRALNIEHAVVRALIGVPAYKHGVRSLEAVLEMSMLDGRTGFDPAALPPPEQLEQHVDAAAFGRLVVQGVLFAAAREAIAEAIHERYRRNHAKDREPGSAVLSPWPELPEVYRKSNRAQADDVLRKLESIDCGYRATSAKKPSSFRFSKQEIERLAELEHERWMNEKQAAGYSLGPTRDETRRTHPDLLPWKELSEKVRDYDRNAVAATPEYMAAAGFEIYRL